MNINSPKLKTFPYIELHTRQVWQHCHQEEKKQCGDSNIEVSVHEWHKNKETRTNPGFFK
jgi:hypothetical protein